MDEDSGTISAESHLPNGGSLGAMPGWITPALLARTIEVWSEAYGRPVGPTEAIEILSNVKRLGEVLLRVRREG